MKLSDEQKQALADAEAHLSLARSALNYWTYDRSEGDFVNRIANAIDVLRHRIQRKKGS